MPSLEENRRNVGGHIESKSKGSKSVAHSDATKGGYFKGKRHSEDGGIKAVNKTTGQPLLVEDSEVIITRNAVLDNKKRMFEGKMMTNKEILSKINEEGGGVSFAKGGYVPRKLKMSKKHYDKHKAIMAECGYEVMGDGGEVKSEVEKAANDFVLKMKSYGISATKRVSKNGVFVYGEKSKVPQGLSPTSEQEKKEGTVSGDDKVVGSGVGGDVDFAKRKKEIKSENDKLQKRKYEIANDRDDVVTSAGKYKNFGKRERDAMLEEIRAELKSIDTKQEALIKEHKVIEAKETGSVELFDHYGSSVGGTNTIIYDIKNNKLLERENVVRGKTREISIEDAAKKKFEKTQRGRSQREINESYTDKVKEKYEAEITDEINNYIEQSLPTQEMEMLRLHGKVYDKGGEVKEHKKIYQKWKHLVNMSKSELEKFYNSEEGKEAGLSASEAHRQGIDSGRESARWIMRMKSTPVSEWTPTMWKWANKQISFISRMSGNKGGLYDEKGNKTRKHTSLLIWGHNPEKKEYGGNIDNGSGVGEDVNATAKALEDLQIGKDYKIMKLGKLVNKGVDAFYKHLKMAQRNSDKAKEEYGYYGNRNLVNTYYYIKMEAIKKAVNRAKKLRIKTIYDPIEEAIYFETPNGQVSFHIKGERNNEWAENNVENIEGYKWSGKENSDSIIDSYFDNENPKKIAIAYQKAKADGSNPELVKYLEQLVPTIEPFKDGEKKEYGGTVHPIHRKQIRKYY